MLTANDSQVVADEAPIVSLQAPRQRRVSLIAVGGLLVVVAALVAAWLVASAGETQRVLIAQHDLNAGQVIDVADVQVVEIGGSVDVQTVPADSQTLVVGRAAVSAVPAGTLLNPSMFVDAGESIPAGSTAVGAILDAGQFPVADLGPGAKVSLMATFDAGSEPATLLGFGVLREVDRAESGQYWVTLLVTDDLSLSVSSAAASGQLRLGVVP